MIRSAEGNIYTKISDKFCFPKNQIKTGDLIVLYSKNESDNKKYEYINTVYFYY